MHAAPDFVSLRQVAGAFSLRHTNALIKEIGCTMAEIDSEMEYARRSYCLFEAFATVRAKKPLLCQTPPEVQLHMLQIQSQHAKTRSAADKHLIDSFIEGTIGFEEFDKTMTLELRRALCQL